MQTKHASCAGIEDLREKREEVQKQIRDEENEKAKLQQDLQMLTKRLAHINDGLARKVGDVAWLSTMGIGRTSNDSNVAQSPLSRTPILPVKKELHSEKVLFCSTVCTCGYVFKSKI